MGDLKVGDSILHPRGYVQKVIQIFDRGEQDVFEFEFVDGGKTTVDMDHLWRVHRTCRHSKTGEFWEVMDTRNILKFYAGDGIKGDSILIPLCEPLSFCANARFKKPLDPYLLGVLIGDGYLNGRVISWTKPEPFIAEKIKSLGYFIHQSPSQVNLGIWQVEEARIGIRKLGMEGCLANSKFIPEQYKWLPIEDRISLLQGLMDTDGYVDITGHLQYTTVSERLAKDIQWVIWSLGGKATITSKIPSYTLNGKKMEGQRAYTLYIQTTSNSDLVSLPRKRDRIKTDKFNGGASELHRRLVSVKPAGREATRCFVVSSPDGLYITDDFIVTHNTDAGMVWMVHPTYVENPRYRGLVIRRNATDLSDWIDRARWMYHPLGATFTGVPAEIRFPAGSVIRLGHLRDEGAYTKYQGHEYQRILIEELTHIPTEDLYEKLVASCRSTVDELPPRIFCTTNPDGDGRMWVKKRFVNIATPGTIWRDTDTGRSRVYIPSTVQDNPYLMKDDRYLKSLQSISDPDLRKAWLDGDWDAFSIKGSIYGDLMVEARKQGRITNVPLEKYYPVDTYWDLGFDDATTIIFSQHVGAERRLIDYYEMGGMDITHFAALLKQKGYFYGTHWLPHDSAFHSMQTGRSMFEILKDLLPLEDFRIVPRMGGRMNSEVQEGINAVRMMFNTLWFDAKKCARLIECLENYRREWDEILRVYRPKPVHDWASHGADSARYMATVSLLMDSEGQFIGKGKYGKRVNAYDDLVSYERGSDSPIDY